MSSIEADLQSVPFDHSGNPPRNKNFHDLGVTPVSQTWTKLAARLAAILPDSTPTRRSPNVPEPPYHLSGFVSGSAVYWDRRLASPY